MPKLAAIGSSAASDDELAGISAHLIGYGLDAQCANSLIVNAPVDVPAAVHASGTLRGPVGQPAVAGAYGGESC